MNETEMRDRKLLLSMSRKWIDELRRAFPTGSVSRIAIRFADIGALPDRVEIVVDGPMPYRGESEREK